MAAAVGRRVFDQLQSVGVLIHKIHRRHALIEGPVVGLLVFLCADLNKNHSGLTLAMCRMLGLAAFMVTWWLNGAVRMGATGLLPIVMLPVLGITSGRTVPGIYFSNGVLVFWGSMLMAGAVQRYGLHQRIARVLLQLTQRGGRVGIVSGFVAVTAFMSMWLSNTATAVLMVPLSNAIIERLKRLQLGDSSNSNNNCCVGSTITSLPAAATTVLNPALRRLSDDQLRDFGSAIDLGVAFASTLGGMATITGTGANVALQGTLLAVFGPDAEVTFLEWFCYALPLVLVNLLLLLLVLLSVFIGFSDTPPSMHHHQQQQQRTHRYQRSMRYSTLRSASSVDHTVVALEGGGLQLSDVNNNTDAAFDSCLTTAAAAKDAVNGTYSDANEEALTTSTRSLTYPECVVMVMFTLMASLWLTRDPPSGWGWGRLFPDPDFITDGTVAMMCCLVLFVTPAQPPQFLGNAYQRCSLLLLLLQQSVNRSQQAAVMTQSPLHCDSSSYEDTSCANTATAVADADTGDAAPVIGLSRRHAAASISSPNATAITNTDTSTATATAVDAALLKRTASDAEELAASTTAAAESEESDRFILQWKAVAELNWDVIFLLGGGFALSRGFTDAGLSQWMSKQIVTHGLSSLNALIASSSVLTCAATNIMSNVAAANILLPALACVGPQNGKAPLSVLLPVAMSASLALLLPIGTPPNAIVVSNGRVSCWQLLAVGGICTALCLSAILLHGIYLLPLLYNERHLSAEEVDSCL